MFVFALVAVQLNMFHKQRRSRHTIITITKHVVILSFLEHYCLDKWLKK